ncbi:hypothetical protein GCM10010299_57170 [Streptomyces tanashiensis]|nr:hypothetical protein GCM10010299_57170 [Streptomyces tanashiensis]
MFPVASAADMGVLLLLRTSGASRQYDTAAAGNVTWPVPAAVPVPAGERKRRGSGRGGLFGGARCSGMWSGGKAREKSSRAGCGSRTERFGRLDAFLAPRRPARACRNNGFRSKGAIDLRFCSRFHSAREPAEPPDHQPPRRRYRSRSDLPLASIGTA